MEEGSHDGPRFVGAGVSTGTRPRLGDLEARIAEAGTRDRLYLLGLFGVMAWTGGAVNRYVSMWAGLDLLGYELAADVATVLGIAASVVLIVLTRVVPVSDRALDAVGLVFGLATSLVTELIFVDAALPELPMRAVPWSVMLAVFFPVYLQWSMRLVVLWGVTIAMIPIGVLFLGPTFGAPWPDPWEVAQWALGPVFGSLFAVIPVMLVRSAQRQTERALARARDLGAYRLETRLGKGGMGEVWRAVHRMLARPVALKIIRSDKELGSARREEIRSRFFQEARATAELTSPHTVSLFDFGAAPDGSLYYVMELLEGQDLEAVVKVGGPLPPARLVHVLQQVCDSLEEAHARGLVHRDVKPANVMLCRIAGKWDFVKVLDFGIVRRVEAATADSHETAAGSIAGTPAFMAPEAARSSHLGPQADLYSLGCLAWFALCGAPPFKGETPVDLMVKHATEPLPTLSEVAGGPVPPELEAVVTRLLAKDPAGRPESAATLRAELDALPIAAWTAADADAWWQAHGAPSPERATTGSIETWEFATRAAS